MKFFPLSALSLSLGLLLAPHAQAADSVAAAQSRIQALQSAGVAADNYNLAKAQCWVNAANTAQSENDRSGLRRKLWARQGSCLARSRPIKTRRHAMALPAIAVCAPIWRLS